MGQFYPWREYGAHSLRSGSIPLWNPYQFSGAPFVANSQSAVFYPGNVLYYVLGTKRAAGWTAAIHLFLTAWFMWLFVRAIGGSSGAGALAGIAFAFCTWQVSWLQLPTFLCTCCWLPLALLLVLRLLLRPALHTAARLGGVLGLVLLAGHLQIAFYVLIACALLVLYLLAVRGQGRPTGGLLFLASLALAFMLAAPQLIPALELSRRSHRVGPPTAAGYQSYTGYAVPLEGLVTLFQPDYFGNPSNPDEPYVGRSRSGMPFNYAEGALYVGLPTLLLAGLGLTRGMRSAFSPFLVGLAVLALLMALGTAVDALLYFHAPGFGQSGSPGRALVLWAFGLAALAGIGFDLLQLEDGVPVRSAILTVVGLAVIWGAAYARAGSQVTATESGGRLPLQAALFLCAAGLVLAAAKWRAGRAWLSGALGVLLVVDLFAAGFGYNQTAAPNEVYPQTASTRLAARLARHDRIAPINTDWSFAGPTAVLPPNGAMALGLGDVQGYDSLFPGQYKAFMNRVAGPGRDASPVQVGNMVFARDPQSPLLRTAGVRVVLSLDPLNLPGAKESYEDAVHVYELPDAPGRASAVTDNGKPVPVAWLQDDPSRVRLVVDSAAPCTLRLADEMYPGWHASVDGHEAPIVPDTGVFRRVRVPAGRHEVGFEYRPAGFQAGLYLMLLAASLLVARAIWPRMNADETG